jgi:hypothetical protein
VAALLPYLIVGQTFVRQPRQAETGVGDADPACIVGQDLSGDVHQAAPLGLDHFPGLRAAVDQYQLACTVIRVLCHLLDPKRDRPWRCVIPYVNGGITPRAIRKVFESYLVEVWSDPPGTSPIPGVIPPMFMSNPPGISCPPED